MDVHADGDTKKVVMYYPVMHTKEACRKPRGVDEILTDERILRMCLLSGYDQVHEKSVEVVRKYIVAQVDETIEKALVVMTKSGRTHIVLDDISQALASSGHKLYGYDDICHVDGQDYHVVEFVAGPYIWNKNSTEKNDCDDNASTLVARNDSVIETVQENKNENEWEEENALEDEIDEDISEGDSGEQSCVDDNEDSDDDDSSSSSSNHDTSEEIEHVQQIKETNYSTFLEEVSTAQVKADNTLGLYVTREDIDEHLEKDDLPFAEGVDSDLNDDEGEEQDLQFSTKKNGVLISFTLKEGFDSNARAFVTRSQFYELLRAAFYSKWNLNISKVAISALHNFIENKVQRSLLDGKLKMLLLTQVNEALLEKQVAEKLDSANEFKTQQVVDSLQREIKALRKNAALHENENPAQENMSSENGLGKKRDRTVLSSLKNRLTSFASSKRAKVAPK